MLPVGLMGPVAANVARTARNCDRVSMGCNKGSRAGRANRNCMANRAATISMASILLEPARLAGTICVAVHLLGPEELVELVTVVGLGRLVEHVGIVGPMHSYQFFHIHIHSYAFLYTPMHSYEFPCIPMHSYAFLCIPMTPIHSYAFLCTPMHSYSFLLIPMHSYAFPCIPMHSYAFLFIPMNSYAFLCIPIHTYAFL